MKKEPISRYIYSYFQRLISGLQTALINMIKHSKKRFQLNLKRGIFFKKICLPEILFFENICIMFIIKGTLPFKPLLDL